MMRLRLLLAAFLAAEGVRQIVVESHLEERQLYGAFLLVFAALMVLWGRVRPFVRDHRHDERGSIYHMVGLTIVLLSVGLTLSGVESAFNSYDLVLISAGVFVMLVPHIPRDFHWESDFILYFFLFFTAFVVLVHKVSMWAYWPGGGARAYLNAGFTVAPLTGWLQMIGLDVIRVGQSLYFDGPGGLTTVHVGPPCSGYFSMFTFLAVILAYLAASGIGWRNGAKWAVVGLAIAYLANMFRLTVLVVIGMNYGYDTMFMVHTYLGTVLFVGWNLILWIPLLYRFRGRSLNGGQRGGSGSTRPVTS